jgi:iron complex transport system ATP-binding protein
MGASGMTPLLSAEGLSVGYAGQPLVGGLRLELLPGELTALLGLNGTGKSTLLRTLAGLQPALDGRLMVLGKELRSMTALERARAIAMVLSGRPRTGMLDAQGLVELGRQPWTGRSGRLAPADREQVARAMAVTGTAHLARRGFASLSDGEAQRVLIARAVAQQSSVLLLDEPTAHLDLVNRAAALHLLRDVAEGLQRAVLLSTHDAQLALRHAHRIVVLHGGRAWSGRPDEAAAMLREAFGEMP